ncbi:hypothetical protein WR25_11506 [Diploscapter pachys]|uniref:Reverse transcriptase domain-containing protein n=1 Tax=Diploscapter pachys TaxID=2018661 RepID=A0A2A2JK60_9BILA|nr:hypothetical protein WR25_11506 [Diploscapter pachys]
MKIGKCTGPDDIPAEVWKLAGDKGVRFLTKLYNKIVEDNEIPAEWKKSTTKDLKKLKERLERHGLRINTSKTEYLELEPRTSGDIELDGTKLPRVTDFKYRGDRISADGESLSAVKGRIDAAWLKWRQCSGVLCDRKMPTKLKSRIYRTVVRPVALYGSQI